MYTTHASTPNMEYKYLHVDIYMIETSTISSPHSTSSSLSKENGPVSALLIFPFTFSCDSLPPPTILLCIYSFSISHLHLLQQLLITTLSLSITPSLSNQIKYNRYKSLNVNYSFKVKTEKRMGHTHSLVPYHTSKVKKRIIF